MGMMRYPNGDIYNGDWYGGERTGVGFMQYHNGDVYQGRWLADARHGKGRYNWASGEEFLGEFNENHMVQGIFVNSEGLNTDIKLKDPNTTDRSFRTML